MKTEKTTSNKFAKLDDSRKSFLDNNLLFDFLNDEELVNDYLAPRQFSKSVKIINPLLFDGEDFDSANLNNLVLALGNQDKNDKYLTFSEPSKSVKYSNTLVFGSDDVDSQNLNQLLLGFLHQKVNDDYLTSLPLSVSNSSNLPVLIGAEASQNNQDLQNTAADSDNKTVENNNDTVISRTISEVSKNAETQLDETKIKDNLTVVFAENLEIDNSSELELLDIYGIVDKALQDTYNYLGKFRFDSEYSQKLETAFGTGFNREAADNLFDKFADKNFTDIPTIKIVNRSAIYGGNGAFSADTGLVYLATEFLAENSQNTVRVTDVLIEEIGHFVDSEINQFDSPGDEGDIFSELVQGNTLSDEELQALRAENDIVNISNSQVQTEQNGTATQPLLRVGTWNILYNDSGKGTHKIHRERLEYLNNYIGALDIDVMVIQEFNPQKYDSNYAFGKIFSDTNLNNLFSGTNYSYKVLTEEYYNDDTQEWYKRRRNGQTGYLVLYNKNKVTLSDLEYYSSTAGTNYWQSEYQNIFYRPPIKFTAQKNGDTYNFFTYHNEESKLEDDQVNERGLTDNTNFQEFKPKGSTSFKPQFQTLHTLDSLLPVSNDIILGDFNVSENQFKGSLINYKNQTPIRGLNKKNDFVVSNDFQISEIVINSTDKKKLLSDHYAIFAEISPLNSTNTGNGIKRKIDSAEIQTVKKAKTSTSPISLSLSHASPILLEQFVEQNYSYEIIEEILLGDNEIYLIGDSYSDNDYLFGSLITIDGGKVIIGKDKNDGKKYIYVEKLGNSTPKIYSDTGYHQDVPLFTGELRLDPNNLKANITELGDGSEPDFDIMGVEVTFSDLAFVDDHLELQGKLKLPDKLGGLEVSVEVDEEKGTNNKIVIGYPGEEVQVTESEKITIGDYGVAVTGASLKLPGTRKFNALGLIEIQTEDAALDFNFDELEATMTGKFVVPSLKDATLNLTDGNYIKIKNEEDQLKFAMAAALSVNDINIYGDWKLSDINVNVEKTYDNTRNTVGGNAKLYTSKDKYLYLGLQFENGKLKQVSASSPEGPDFTFFGMDVDFRELTFTPDRKPEEGEDWDPELKFQGGIKLPDKLGGFAFDVTGNDYLIINEDGFDLTGGEITINDFDTKLLGLGIKGTDVKLSYTHEQNSKVFKIQGDLALSVGKYTLEGDFSGGNYIKIDDSGDVTVVGKVSFSDIDVGSFKLKNLAASIDTSGEKTKIEAGGILEIPSGVDVKADASWHGTQLEYIEVGVQNINRPIGDTGFFFQDIDVSYNNDTTTFKGDSRITGGPEVNLKLPDFLGGEINNASLIDLKLDVEINPDHLKATGTMEVLGGHFKTAGEAKVGVDLNWNHGYFIANGHLETMGGSLTANTKVIARVHSEQVEVEVQDTELNSTTVENADWFMGTEEVNDINLEFPKVSNSSTRTEFDLYGFAEGIYSLPSWIPWIGGTRVGSAGLYFQYIGDNENNNDYIAAWGQLGGFKDKAIKVGFDGSIGVIEGISESARNNINKLENDIKNDYERNSIAHKPLDEIKGDDDHGIHHGTDGTDLIRGNGGNDTLNGGHGVDILIGGDGDDVLIGGAAEDIYIFDTDTQQGSDTINETVIALKTFHNTYVRADKPLITLGKWNIDQNHFIDDWEKFTVVNNDDGTISLKTFHNTYVRADKPWNPFHIGKWNIDQNHFIGDWEKFKIDGDGTISLKTFHDTYVRADKPWNPLHIGKWNIDQNHFIGDWEKFTVINQDNNSSDTLNFAKTTTKNIDLDLSKADKQRINENLSLTLGITIGSQTFINIENAVGGHQDDTLRGNHLSNHLSGNKGNDTLLGRAGDDYIDGEEGNDWLTGEWGQDTVKGGAGDDTVLGGNENPDGDSANDQLWGGTGNDYLDGEQGNDWLSGEQGQDTIKGGAGDDVVLGGNETANGDSANDELWGGAGNDYLDGEQGNDWLTGEWGRDTLKGGDGDDTVLGGNETPNGDSANDELWGGAGNDYLDGEQGNDWLTGEWGRDTLKGGAGDDTVLGGNEIPNGDSANDELWGGEGNDFLYGEQGNDILHGNAGNDTLIGGTGADVFIFELNQGTDIIEDFSASDGDKIEIGGTFKALNKSQFIYDSVTGALSYSYNINSDSNTSDDIHFATLNTDSNFDVSQHIIITSAPDKIINLTDATGQVLAKIELSRNAYYNSTIGFYEITNGSGGIDTDDDGIADVNPGDDGYRTAAWENRIAGLDSLKAENGDSNKASEVTFNGGSVYAPFIVVDETDEAYFPFLEANSDASEHVKLLGSNSFGFEDTHNLYNDQDFNDIILTVTFPN